MSNPFEEVKLVMLVVETVAMNVPTQTLGLSVADEPACRPQDWSPGPAL